MTLPRASLANNDSPIALVLERLEHVRRSASGWTAQCPAHEDRWPSLSIREGRDGRVLIFCFAGCVVDDIAKAMHLDLADLFPRIDTPVPRRRPKLSAVPRKVAEGLLENERFPTTWAFSWRLAELPAPDARVEILKAWRPIADVCDIRLLVALSDTIRGIALLNFGRPEDFRRPWSLDLGAYIAGRGYAPSVQRLRRAVEDERAPA